MNRYNFDGVYTPQLVVDGRSGFVGSDGKEASAAIQKAIRERKIAIAISNLARNGNQVTARIELPAGESLKGASGILYVALADNRQESHVARGENGGHTLSHVAVTRVLKQVGPIDLGASVKEIALPIPAGIGKWVAARRVYSRLQVRAGPGRGATKALKETWRIAL
jgi:hypothetical protein